MRTFDSGATRDSEEGKYDYEGFLSPLVMERFGQYMHSHRFGNDPASPPRDSDNWQKGIPLAVYIKSAFRHFLDWWRCHRGFKTGVEGALCALMFNVMGYLHVVLVEKKKGENKTRQALIDSLDGLDVIRKGLDVRADRDAPASLVRDFE